VSPAWLDRWIPCGAEWPLYFRLTDAPHGFQFLAPADPAPATEVLRLTAIARRRGAELGGPVSEGPTALSDLESRSNLNGSASASARSVKGGGIPPCACSALGNVLRSKTQNTVLLPIAPGRAALYVGQRLTMLASKSTTPTSKR
jgi:hypothetical protein